jgi:hypothetical protein
MDWIRVNERLPAEGVLVETKISDKQSERNLQVLQRRKNLWFHPEGTMYVYYTPTHWREKR